MWVWVGGWGGGTCRPLHIRYSLAANILTKGVFGNALLRFVHLEKPEDVDRTSRFCGSSIAFITKPSVRWISQSNIVR